MSNKKYLEIKTVEELDAAIAESGALLDRKAARLRRGLSAAQEFYSPSTLVGEGVRHAASKIEPITVAGVVLTLVSRCRRRRRKKKK